jgi:hypothetical protein
VTGYLLIASAAGISGSISQLLGVSKASEEGDDVYLTARLFLALRRTHALAQRSLHLSLRRNAATKETVSLTECARAAGPHTAQAQVHAVVRVHAVTSHIQLAESVCPILVVATDSFYERMRSHGKSITPTLSGGSVFPIEAVNRRDELAREVLALVQRRNLSGITLDYEGKHTGGANQSQFAETWRSVAELLHANGGGKKTLAICVGERQENRSVGETTIDFGHAWKPYIPFVDTMTQMATYCDHCSECLLHGEGCPFRFTEASVPALESIVQRMLTAGVQASTQQLSPGIWLGRCVNGTAMTTGWTRPFLRKFLAYQDKVGVCSLDVWTDAGSGPDVGANNTTCPMPCPSTPTCGWALDELRAWRRR